MLRVPLDGVNCLGRIRAKSQPARLRRRALAPIFYAMVETTDGLMSPIYAAGLFDGEGYIGLAKDGPRLRLRLEVSGCYRPGLERLSKRWGGLVYRDKRKVPNWRPEWKWCLNRREDIGRFCSDVQPYLLEKQGQVALALAMLAGDVSRELADAELRRMKRVSWN